MNYDVATTLYHTADEPISVCAVIQTLTRRNHGLKEPTERRARSRSTEPFGSRVAHNIMVVVIPSQYRNLPMNTNKSSSDLYDTCAICHYGEIGVCFGNQWWGILGPVANITHILANYLVLQLGSSW